MLKYHKKCKRIMEFKKPFDWSTEKNQKLLEERGLSFEAIILAIEAGKVLDIVPHPTLAHQKILVIEIETHVVLVPFVEDDEKYFLKTAYHSRKAFKTYKKGEPK